MARIWLKGARSSDLYLYDTDTGLHRKFVGRDYAGATSGTISLFGKVSAAAYLAADGHTVVLQVGRTHCPLGSGARAKVRSSLAGLLTEVTVEQNGSTVAVLTRRARRGEATAIADLVNSPEARETFRAVSQRDRGPGACWAVHGA